MGFLFESMTPDTVPFEEWFKPSEKWIEKFWSKIDRSGGQDACWPWLKGKMKGYGRLAFTPVHKQGAKLLLAHRVAFILSGGVLTEENPMVLHRCVASRACCNFAHLYAGDFHQNSMDMVEQGRHPSVLHPERVASGDNHWTRRKPHLKTRGSKIPWSLLKEDQVREIRGLSASGMSAMDIAKKYGTSDGAIYGIIRRASWKHVI